MKMAQYLYTENGWNKELDGSLDTLHTLIIIFAPSNTSRIKIRLKEIAQQFPLSQIIGCSTAGEIYQNRLCHYRFVMQIIQFEKSTIKLVVQKITQTNDSKKVGEELAKKLYNPELKAIFILSDGLHVNGSQLTKGLSSQLSNDVIVTGGLAGDDDRFEKTWIIVNSEPKEQYISGVGFYGKSLYYGYGSEGGWNKLGPKREVTSSVDNVLYTLDSQPALTLYKRYLGERAEGLPNTGLLFPLAVYIGDEIKVRTILSVDEEQQSITFAGDIPQGYSVSLMKANFNQLINGASNSAKSIKIKESKVSPLTSIAISCIGRRLVLGQRVEEEIEAVLDNLPEHILQIGYYSYGEISPLSSGKCDLHNQTMTLTIIGEY